MQQGGMNSGTTHQPDIGDASKRGKSNVKMFTICN